MKAIIHRKEKTADQPKWIPAKTSAFKWVKARVIDDPDKLEYYALPSDYGVLYIETIHGGMSYSRVAFFQEEYEMQTGIEVTMTLTEFI